MSELDFEKTTYKHATIISNDFDFLSLKYTYLFCQLAMLISHLSYYLVHFIAFLQTLRNISHMKFIKQN